MTNATPTMTYARHGASENPHQRDRKRTRAARQETLRRRQVRELKYGGAR